MVKKGLCLPHPGELWGLIYLFDCTINLPSTIHVRKPFNKNFNSLNLKSKQGSTINGSGTISNILDPESLRFDLNFQRIYLDLTTIFKDVSSLPEEIQRLEKLGFGGILKGNLTDISVDGKVETALGNLTLDANTIFNDDYTQAEYSGFFDLDNFDLGYMLNDTLLGISNFEGTINGSGLTLSEFEGEIDGEVESFYGKCSICSIKSFRR